MVLILPTYKGWGAESTFLFNKHISLVEFWFDLKVIDTNAFSVPLEAQFHRD